MTEPPLTPREYAAIHIFAALISNPQIGNVTELMHSDNGVTLAVNVTNSLFQRLEKTQPK